MRYLQNCGRGRLPSVCWLSNENGQYGIKPFKLIPTENFDSRIKVWQLLRLTDSKRIRKASGKQILSAIGLALVSIWQYHWKMHYNVFWLPNTSISPSFIQSAPKSTKYPGSYPAKRPAVHAFQAAILRTVV
ncbi:hypothetical protein BGW37DRAFT_523924 [Umbelopsis sp. PMI_123]|nr:hypothetical protein BGW37DRAFT_523924 [Umbelopsis sp. PMI_123]